MGKSARAPKTARDMLDTLDKFLATGQDEAKTLWDVLTALRGPDNGSDQAKEHATIPIRRAAFPRTTEAYRHKGDVFYIGADFGYYEEPITEIELPPIVEDHLRFHVEYAAVALGLKTKERPEVDNFTGPSSQA
jgi:hypothetical protein